MAKKKLTCDRASFIALAQGTLLDRDARGVYVVGDGCQEALDAAARGEVVYLTTRGKIVSRIEQGVEIAEEGGLKAWLVTVDGTVSIIRAETRGAAIHHSWKSAKEAGYSYWIKLFRAVRAQKYDRLTRRDGMAEHVPYTLDAADRMLAALKKKEGV